MTKQQLLLQSSFVNIKSMVAGFSFLFLCGSRLFSAMLASEYGDQSWSKKCLSSPRSISSSSSLHFLSSTWFHCMANPLTSLGCVWWRHTSSFFSPATTNDHDVLLHVLLKLECPFLYLMICCNAANFTSFGDYVPVKQ